MAWGKESYDELRALNLNLKSVESLSAEVLNQVSKDQDLRFWEKAFIAAASGILSNDSADNVFRPDMVAEKAAILADSLLEIRKCKIAEMQNLVPKNEDSI